MQVPSPTTWGEIEARVAAHGSTWDNLSSEPKADIRNAMQEVDEIISRTGVDGTQVFRFRVNRLGSATLHALPASLITDHQLQTTVAEGEVYAA